MDGMVAVAFRFEDGSVACLQREAGSLPSFIQDIRLLERDRPFIDAYATSAGNGEGLPLGPSGHGLVVVDLLDSRVLDMQDGCGRLDTFQGDAVRDSEPLLEAGRLRPRMRGGEAPASIGQPFGSVGNLVAWLGETGAQPESDEASDILVDLSPFTYQRYERHQAGDLRRQMLALGFTLDEAAQAQWSDWEKSFTSQRAA